MTTEIWSVKGQINKYEKGHFEFSVFYPNKRQRDSEFSV